MLSETLDCILGPRSQVGVLRVLFKEDALSGREVARRAGLSPRAASLALSNLVAAGVIQRRQAGGSHFFSVNGHRHVVVSGLRPLFALEESLPSAIGDRIMEAVGRHKCVSVAIFGSFARSESVHGSDLDVLVLLDDSARVPRVRDLLDERAGKFHDSFGIRLSPYVVSAAEFAQRFKKDDRLIKAMVREARIIAGKPLAEVLVDESQEKNH